MNGACEGTHCGKPCSAGAIGRSPQALRRSSGNRFGRSFLTGRQMSDGECGRGKDNEFRPCMIRGRKRRCGRRKRADAAGRACAAGSVLVRGRFRLRRLDGVMRRAVGGRLGPVVMVMRRSGSVPMAGIGIGRDHCRVFRRRARRLNDRGQPLQGKGGHQEPEQQCLEKAGHHCPSIPERGIGNLSLPMAGRSRTSLISTACRQPMRSPGDVSFGKA
ncbi:hypothetical protein SAMN06265795_10342 [Noviherbaspirillum humi]|uniref:Uncharacterized protein n=1 Tax=Noviherbaspirillum humi TaxID=1688639 RepID=A0A239EVS9_9BURK|nr:hypothetical protein SAMN06265795_10342 [Noviherbaspirillum humi]